MPSVAGSRFDPAILPALVGEARGHGEELYFELEQIAVPTLIVRRERSFLRPEQVGEIASALRNVRVETLTGAGHFLVREQPVRLARLVIDFLVLVRGLRRNYPAIRSV